jgi:hypothetical protein
MWISGKISLYLYEKASISPYFVHTIHKINVEVVDNSSPSFFHNGLVDK